MKHRKTILLPIAVVRKIICVIGRLEDGFCIGCPGAYHQKGCPVIDLYGLQRYLMLSVKNRSKKY